MEERKRPKAEKPETDAALTEDERLKYEIAEELGLMPKVKETGWRSLTAKESGRIGGLMTKRKRRQK